MQIINKEIPTKIIRISAEENGQELGYASLCLIYNDTHKEPYGLFADIIVSEDYRGGGIGTKLVEEVIKKAKELGCYKLIATSRYTSERVHNLYTRLGFTDWGKEFRIDF